MTATIIPDGAASFPGPTRPLLSQRPGGPEAGDGRGARRQMRAAGGPVTVSKGILADVPGTVPLLG
jgi:hypothetical protein